jgi:hypothetical protein
MVGTRRSLVHRAHRRATVLVVGRTPAQLALGRGLAAEGVPVCAVRDGQKAGDLLRAGLRPLLVLVDIEWLDLGEILSLLDRPPLLRVPIVIVSPFDDEDAPARFTFFLRGPDLESLLWIVRALSSARTSHRHGRRAVEAPRSARRPALRRHVRLSLVAAAPRAVGEETRDA